MAYKGFDTLAVCSSIIHQQKADVGRRGFKSRENYVILECSLKFELAAILSTFIAKLSLKPCRQASLNKNLTILGDLDN